MSLRALCRQLAASPVSKLMQDHEWLVPAIQTVHILCLAVVFPAVLFFSLRLCGLIGRGRPLGADGRTLLPWATPGLLGLAASGALLIMAEPARELPNPAFQCKMAMLLAALALTAFQLRSLHRLALVTADSHGVRRPLVLRLSAVATLGLWTAIVVAGRWIAYMVEN